MNQANEQADPSNALNEMHVEGWITGEERKHLSDRPVNRDLVPRLVPCVALLIPQVKFLSYGNTIIAIGVRLNSEPHSLTEFLSVTDKFKSRLYHCWMVVEIRESQSVIGSCNDKEVTHAELIPCPTEASTDALPPPDTLLC